MPIENLLLLREWNIFSGSILAERAEKVFMTHMEIIRLKYPGSLGRLRHDCKGPPTFGIRMRVSPNPVILLGAGVFLPHGENILTPISFKVSLWMLEDQNGVRKKLIASQTVSLDKSAQFEHSKMCIDYKTGSKYAFRENFPTKRVSLSIVTCLQVVCRRDRQISGSGSVVLSRSWTHWPAEEGKKTLLRNPSLPCHVSLSRRSAPQLWLPSHRSFLELWWTMYQSCETRVNRRGWGGLQLRWCWDSVGRRRDPSETHAEPRPEHYFPFQSYGESRHAIFSLLRTDSSHILLVRKQNII